MAGNPVVFVTLLVLLASSSCGFASSKAGQLMGVVDGLRSEAVDQIDVTGWACSSAVRDSVKVTIFAGDPRSGGIELITVVANQKSSPAIAKACGIDGAFAFVAPVVSAQLGKYAGKAIVAIAASGTARQVLGGPARSLPGNAGSVEDVAGLAGFHMLVDCSINGGINCATGINPAATGIGGPPAYAYAASIVTVAGGYHMFYCSVGLQGGWDAIRSSFSADGIHWNTAILKLVTTGAANRDLSACDPSVVFFQGYYYLYYGSAYVSSGGNKQTVIQVARSATIDGTYLVFSESGKWGATAHDPPAMLVKPANDVARSYGAGQPSVMVASGKLWMWYTDDTSSYPHGNILMMQSSNPTVWTNPAVTDAHTVNVDVKWSQRSKQYVMFSVDPVDGREVVRTRASKDGLTWSAPVELSQMPNNPSSFFEQNIGVSADSSGMLAEERSLVTYMSPFVGQLRTPVGQDLTGKLSRPHWNLYGAFAPVP